MKLKRTIFGSLAMAAAFIPAMTSCSGEDERDLNCEYIAVQKKECSYWSFYSPDNDIKFEDGFKNPPSDVVDGYFFVREGDNDFYTLYKFGDKLDAVADGLKQVGYMGEGLVPAVRENQRITLLDGEGQVKHTLEPVHGREVLKCRPQFAEGLLGIAVDDGKGSVLWGYLGTDGKVAVSPKYPMAADFHDGLAIVCLSREDYLRNKKFSQPDEDFFNEDRFSQTDEDIFNEYTRWGIDYFFNKGFQFAIIDKEGVVVKKFKPGALPLNDRFTSGRLALRGADGRVLIVDKKGETVVKLPEKVKTVTDCDRDYIVFRDDDEKSGVMTYDGEIIVRPKYDKLYIIGTDRFLGNGVDVKGQHWSVILNGDGKVKMRTGNYDVSWWLGQFGLVGRGSRGIAFYDNTGKVRKGARFYNIGGIEPDDIESDYPVLEEAVAYIANSITDNGVGPYTLGETAEQFYTARPYKDDNFSVYYYRLVQLSKSVDDNDFIQVFAFFSEKRAFRVNDYYYYSTDYFDSDRFTWNPNSRLSFLYFSNDSNKWNARDAEALAQALTKKGFKKEASTVAGKKWYGALLVKGDLAVFILEGKVYVCRNSENNRNEILSIIDKYNKATDKKDLPDINVMYINIL